MSDSEQSAINWFELSMDFTYQAYLLSDEDSDDLEVPDDTEYVPPGCDWKQAEDPRSLKDKRLRLERKYLPEIESCIDSAYDGSDRPLSREARYFLRERHIVICQFLGTTGVWRGDGAVSIFPPTFLDKGSIYRWLMHDWWNAHGVDWLVDNELKRRARSFGSSGASGSSPPERRA